MNSNTSGWLVLTRNFVAGSHPQNDKIIWRKLYKTTDAKIRRHPKIRGAANPFDASWSAYFEDRAFFKKL